MNNIGSEVSDRVASLDMAIKYRLAALVDSYSTENLECLVEDYLELAVVLEAENVIEA